MLHIRKRLGVNLRDPSALLRDDLHVGVLGDPLLHLNGQPEGIDTKGDKGQKEPFDIISEKLCSGAVKGQSVAVNDRMLHIPSLLQANRPRSTEAKRKYNDQPL